MNTSDKYRACADEPMLIQNLRIRIVTRQKLEEIALLPLAEGQRKDTLSIATEKAIGEYYDRHIKRKRK